MQVTNNRGSLAQQSWFNKTTDFLPAGSALENESLTQDSLYQVARGDELGSAGNTYRANLAKTPGKVYTATSSQYKTI